MLNPEISTQEELRNRSKQFALRIIRLFQKRPRSPEAQILGKQLLRSGTSVGANARAAGRARSKPEFIAKIGIVVEEADETVFWLECLPDSGIVNGTASRPVNGGELFVSHLCCVSTNRTPVRQGVKVAPHDPMS